MIVTYDGVASTLIQIASAKIKKYWNCTTVILKDSYMYNSYTTAMKKRACKNERERDSGRKIVQGKRWIEIVMWVSTIKFKLIYEQRM